MAKTAAQNERLTRVGPGTPMGNLLRRYWYPVAAVPEFDENPVRKIRLLGQNFTLFRDKSGDYGLVGAACPHRCISMEYGIPEQHGLRCAYHGWLFDKDGICLEMPYDDFANPAAKFRDRVTIDAHPVKELGGLLFAYIGPMPAPELPKWDLLVAPDLDRIVEMHPIPCNWLQRMDNSMDPLHFEHLHGNFGNYQLGRLGLPRGMTPAKHVKIAFDVFEYGITKRRLLEGEPENSAEWTIGHPILFPSTLAVGNEGAAGLHFRVPIDDTHTVQVTYSTIAREPGTPAKPVTCTYERNFAEDGTPIEPLTTILRQDFIAWVAQQPIADRTNEHLSAGDVGIILFHKMLNENMDKVERGEDPFAVIRDPEKNGPMIEIARGKDGYAAFEIVGAGLVPPLWEGVLSSTHG